MPYTCINLKSLEIDDHNGMATIVPSLVQPSAELHEIKDGIIARPIWLITTHHRITPILYGFASPRRASIFMWGKVLQEYTLFIGGRKYGWSDKDEVNDLATYIHGCIEIESAFYDNRVCNAWMEERRKTKQHFTSKMRDYRDPI